MPILCHHCHTLIPEVLFNQPDTLPCPRCHTALLVRVFPAFFQAPVAGQAAETITSTEDASCFYHPRKKAVVPCADCGRFLCALCDLEIGSRHVCPSCATAAAVGGVAATDKTGRQGLPAGKIEPKRILHDNIALSLAILPVFPVWPLSLVCAPVSLFMAIYYWNEPARNPLPRTRVRLIFAILFSLAILTGWSVLFYSIFHRHF